MPRHDPNAFDASKPIVMARFNTVGGHALATGEPLKIVDDPKERGEVSLETATRLWAGGTFVYAGEARPTPVESPQDAARRLVEMDELGGGWFLIRAPWLGEGEKVQGREDAEKRRGEIIAAGQPAEIDATATAAMAAANATAGGGSESPDAATATTTTETVTRTGEQGGEEASADDRVKALVDGNSETELRDIIERIDAERAAEDPPREPLGAKSDHNKTDLARLIVESGSSIGTDESAGEQGGGAAGEE